SSDLQCSFHIAEKMPSSVNDGSRPIRSSTRLYSSGLSPCSATSSGVIFGSLRIKTFKALRRLFQRLGETGEKPASVGAADRRLNMIFRVRHHAEDVAALVDNAGDRVHRAVVVPVRIDHAVRRGIAEKHPPLAF